MAIARIKPKQRFNDFARLREEAVIALPEFEKLLQSLSERFACACRVGPVKTLKRAAIKAARQETSHEPESVLDYCRGMLIVEDDQLEKFQKIGNALHPKNNPSIAGIIDRISEPLPSTFFKGLYIYPRLSNGHIAEILIIPRYFANTYNSTHEIHEWRSAMLARWQGMGALPQGVQKKLNVLRSVLWQVNVLDAPQNVRDLMLDEI